ncbi:AAA family ATPase [Verrucomicrobium spinosum]|uniref:AAA family ATPase n=1 Tax=Verrucomicrobium spinosum TaxID=2736 RepID=UPI0009464780|nr:ATP-binding protein [Verrucomicrobium spinosum]
MKSRLHRLEIRNFKAFREPFTLELEGRHLLVYGSNGSGKSSLYWALYTFLQSANKPTPGVAKYFDPADPQNLLNIHEKDPATKPGEIALTLRDIATKNDTTYRISQTVHGTRQQPAILKGDLASDFITYRFFFGFSDFRTRRRSTSGRYLRKRFSLSVSRPPEVANAGSDVERDSVRPT